MLKSDSSFLTFLLAFSVLTLTCFAADKKQLSDAVAAVDANLKTPAGKQYDETIGKEFSANHLSNVKQCKQSAPAGASTDPFDMLLKLDAKGNVQEVLIYPETPLAVCMRAALLDGKFSIPPHSDYWVNIHMQFKR